VTTLQVYSIGSRINLLDQHAELDCYSASSLKQQSAGRNVTPFTGARCTDLPPPFLIPTSNKQTNKQTNKQQNQGQKDASFRKWIHVLV
jgi:hypothetical protein